MLRAFMFFDAIVLVVLSMYVALQGKVLYATYFVILGIALLVFGHVLSYWKGKD